MVTLQVVFQYQLPVGVDSIGVLVRNPGIFQVIGTQRLGQLFQRSAEVRRARVAVDKDQPHVDFDARLLQAVIPDIEAVPDFHFTRRFQAAISVVDPTVIGADKGLAIAATRLANAGTAVATNIHQRVDLAIGVAHDDN